MIIVVRFSFISSTGSELNYTTRKPVVQNSQRMVFWTGKWRFHDYFNCFAYFEFCIHFQQFPGFWTDQVLLQVHWKNVHRSLYFFFFWRAHSVSHFKHFVIIFSWTIPFNVWVVHNFIYKMQKKKSEKENRLSDQQMIWNCHCVNKLEKKKERERENKKHFILSNIYHGRRQTK